MIKVEPLNRGNFDEAIELLNIVFAYDTPHSQQAFLSSIDPEVYKKYKATGEIFGKNLEYFVVKNNDGKVIGTTGFYNKDDDDSDVTWLGWYCVDPDFRGQGFGQEILDWTIDEARRRGKKYMRLYTSTRPEEKSANLMYEKNGFKLSNDKPEPDGDYEIVFREKIL
ncbi:MAG: GNAT family N-acetyltransferase [Candidatus Berkelbacteria bacterium]